MKSLSLLIALIELLSFNCVIIVKDQITPKGNNLSNHYGSHPMENLYGPNAVRGVNLLREGYTPGAMITPITNFHKEIDTRRVVSGGLTNTSIDASRIISAPLAPPKAEIKTTFTHDAVIKTPVHIGNVVEEKTSTVVNKFTGGVTAHTVETTKPVVGLLNTVAQVETTHTTVVDMASGQIIKPKTEVKFHGETPLVN